MDYLDYLFLIGRVLFGGFFLLSGIDHFRNTTGLIQYAKSKGVPAPKFSVVITGIVLILGGASVILGFYPMYATILIGLFLLIAAFKVHAFWKMNDQSARSGDRTNFMKNIALVGACMIILAFPAPWPLSVGGSANGDYSARGAYSAATASENDASSVGGIGGANTDAANTISNALGGSGSFGVSSVASITVFNQKAANSATVSLVSTDASSWLAVREDKGGLVGNILGAKRIDIGTTANVEIPLQRATETGKVYHVVLFRDNGDRVFDFKIDPPMVADGLLISKSFLAI